MGASLRGQTTPRQYIQVNTSGYPSTSSHHQSIPVLLTPLGKPSVTHRTLLKSPPIFCFPSWTMLGISDKSKHLQHHWHCKFRTSRHSIYLSHASSHPRTSTPTSRPTPPTYQRLTPHPLPRRRSRVLRVKPIHCCQLHHLQALPIHHLQAMRPHLHSTLTQRHSNHRCNTCARSSQASH